MPELTDLSRALVGLLVAAALAGAIWAAWDRLRRSPWERTQGFVARRLQRLGVHCLPHEGPRAWAQRVQAHLGSAGEALAQTLLELERLRYGPQAAAGGTVPRAWRQHFAATARAARQHKPSAEGAVAAVRSSA